MTYYSQVLYRFVDFSWICSNYSSFRVSNSILVFSLPLWGHSTNHYCVTTARYILYNVQTAGFIWGWCHLIVYVCLQTFQLVFFNSSTLLDLSYADYYLCIRCRMLTKSCFVRLSLIGYVCMSACRPPLGEKMKLLSSC